MSRCFANSASVNWKSESLGILKYERNPNVLIQAFQSWRCKKCFQFAVDHVRLMCDYWPLSLVLPWAHKCNIFNHLDVSTKSTWWLDVSAASPRLDGFLSGIDGLTATWHWLSNNARSVDATAFIRSTTSAWNRVQRVLPSPLQLSYAGIPYIDVSAWHTFAIFCIKQSSSHLSEMAVIMERRLQSQTSPSSVLGHFHLLQAYSSKLDRRECLWHLIRLFSLWKNYVQRSSCARI